MEALSKELTLRKNEGTLSVPTCLYGVLLKCCVVYDQAEFLSLSLLNSQIISKASCLSPSAFLGWF